DSKLPYFKPLGFENLEVIRSEQIAEGEEGLEGFVPGLMAMSGEQAEEFTLDSVNMDSVNKEAERIIDKANEEAQSIVLDAKVEAEQITEEAKDVGFQQGYEDGKAEMLKLQEDLKKQIQDNAREQQRVLQSIEPQYTNLVVQLLKKLTGVVSSEYKSVILHLIQKTLEENENEENYCIRVSKADYEYVKSKTDSIKSLLKESASIEITIDNKLEKSQCFIETDTSVIECSLDVQLENLITDLRFLAGI
ncbi:FliH/SctL family protein, partial [Anaerosporobacter sp.]|uniref:FliH/SctL family protein n=1 Tax=Anaerosporobacter sp. TaxID=1872529 RepID=UPI00286F6C46